MKKKLSLPHGYIPVTYRDIQEGMPVRLRKDSLGYPSHEYDWNQVLDRIKGTSARMIEISSSPSVSRHVRLHDLCVKQVDKIRFYKKRYTPGSFKMNSNVLVLEPDGKNLYVVTDRRNSMMQPYVVQCINPDNIASRMKELHKIIIRKPESFHIGTAL